MAPVELTSIHISPKVTCLCLHVQDHQHALALFDHFTLAAAQGNIHVMEVLAGALALDLRLHLQVCVGSSSPPSANCDYTCGRGLPCVQIVQLPSGVCWH